MIPNIKRKCNSNVVDITDWRWLVLANMLPINGLVFDPYSYIYTRQVFAMVLLIIGLDFVQSHWLFGTYVWRRLFVRY